MEIFSVGEETLQGVTEVRIKFTEVSGADEITVALDIFGCIKGNTIPR